MGSRSRYKYFDDVWNDNINHAQKGTATVDFQELLQFDDDILYTVTLEDQYRPDNIARNFYGDPKLFWVLVYANNIEDSPEGFYTGRVIRIPRVERVLELA